MHDNIEPGDYCYSRPGMKPIPVTVEKRGDRLVVKFEHSVAGVLLENIPFAAKFVKREADKPCTTT